MNLFSRNDRCAQATVCPLSTLSIGEANSRQGKHLNLLKGDGNNSVRGRFDRIYMSRTHILRRPLLESPPMLGRALKTS